MQSGVAGRGPHGAVYAGEVGEAAGAEGRSDDVEEGGPLGEDDCFGGWVFAAGGGEDVDQGFEFGGAGFWVEVVGSGGADGGIVVVVVIVVGFTKLDGGSHERFYIEGFCTAHGAAVLSFDYTLNAFVAKGVGASCDDRIVKGLEADGTTVSRVDAELKHILKCLLVSRGELDHFLGFEEG